MDSLTPSRRSFLPKFRNARLVCCGPITTAGLHPELPRPVVQEAAGPWLGHPGASLPSYILLSVSVALEHYLISYLLLQTNYHTLSDLKQHAHLAVSMDRESGHTLAGPSASGYLIAATTGPARAGISSDRSAGEGLASKLRGLLAGFRSGVVLDWWP